MEGGLRITSGSQKQEKTLITVITVVFNGCHALEKTIQSVLSQKKPGLEYIVVDGGSTDGTLDILRKYDKDLGYWISAPDKGIFDAFNKGWNLASDESFVLFLGAGDLLISLPDDRVIIPSDVVYGNVLFDEGTKFTSKVDFRLKLGNTVHHQAMLVKKSLSPVSPFDLRFGTYADFDFNQRLFKQKLTWTYASDFEAYALPGGNSKDFRMGEALRIVHKNFGLLYVGLAFVYYIAQRIRNEISGRRI